MDTGAAGTLDGRIPDCQAEMPEPAGGSAGRGFAWAGGPAAADGVEGEPVGVPGPCLFQRPTAQAWLERDVRVELEGMHEHFSKTAGR